MGPVTLLLLLTEELSKAINLFGCFVHLMEKTPVIHALHTYPLYISINLTIPLLRASSSVSVYQLKIRFLNQGPTVNDNTSGCAI